MTSGYIKTKQDPPPPKKKTPKQKTPKKVTFGCIEIIKFFQTKTSLRE